MPWPGKITPSFASYRCSTPRLVYLLPPSTLRRRRSQEVPRWSHWLFAFRDIRGAAQDFLGIMRCRDRSTGRDSRLCVTPVLNVSAFPRQYSDRSTGRWVSARGQSVSLVVWGRGESSIAFECDGASSLEPLGATNVYRKQTDYGLLLPRHSSVMTDPSKRGRRRAQPLDLAASEHSLLTLLRCLFL